MRGLPGQGGNGPYLILRSFCKASNGFVPTELRDLTQDSETDTYMTIGTHEDTQFQDCKCGLGSSRWPGIRWNSHDADDDLSRPCSRARPLITLGSPLNPHNDLTWLLTQPWRIRSLACELSTVKKRVVDKVILRIGELKTPLA